MPLAHSYGGLTVRISHMSELDSVARPEAPFPLRYELHERPVERKAERSQFIEVDPSFSAFDLADEALRAAYAFCQLHLPKARRLACVTHESGEAFLTRGVKSARH